MNGEAEFRLGFVPLNDAAALIDRPGSADTRAVLSAQAELYGKTVTGVIRSTFVIDAAGKLELAQYNVKATGHVAKLRRDLGLG